MNKITLSIFFSLLSITAYANWAPQVYNYTALNSNAGRQNWAVEQGNNGWIYFANNEGLVEFNGIDWSIYKMDNSSVVRAVKAADNGALYIGGQGEFGVFTPDKLGRLHYENLMSQLPNDIKNNFNDIWDIHIINNRVYFRARNNILILDEYNHISSISAEGITQASCVMNNNIYYVTTSGLYIIGGGDPILVGEDRSMIPYGQVSSMVGYEDNIIIATHFDGLFIYNGRQFLPLKTSCDNALKSKQIFSLAIDGDKLACGTVSGGAIIIDLKSGENESIDISNGLGNNTLLSVMFDRDNNLWCGLDNGIDMIRLDSQLRHLRTNKEYRFSGYCTLVDGDYIYLGTNQGLFRINNTFELTGASDEATFISNSEGQVWNIQKINGEIYCSHNHGLYRLEGDRRNPYLKRIYNKDGTWGLTKLAENRYLVRTYGGMELMHFDTNGAANIDKIDNYNSSINICIYDYDSRSLYFVTGEGLERVRFNSSFQIISNDILISSTLHDIKTLHMDNNIVIYTPSDIYIIGDRGELVHTDKYDNLFEKGQLYSMIELDDNRGLWSIDDDRLTYRKYNHEKGEYEANAQQIYNSKHFFIKGFSRVEPLNDRYYIINSIYGFSVIDVEWKSTEHYRVMNPKVISLYSTAQRDSLLLSCAYGVEPKELILPYSHNSLRIIFGSDNIDGNSVEFSYRLRGSDYDWSSWSQISVNGVAGAINQKEYTNLFEGDYTFDLRLRNHNGEIKESAIKIKILPPWQRSVWMYTLYFLLFCALVLYIRHRISRYYADRRRFVELKKEREIINQQRVFIHLYRAGE